VDVVLFRDICVTCEAGVASRGFGTTGGAGVVWSVGVPPVLVVVVGFPFVTGAATGVGGVGAFEPVSCVVLVLLVVNVLVFGSASAGGGAGAGVPVAVSVGVVAGAAAWPSTFFDEEAGGVVVSAGAGVLAVASVGAVAFGSVAFGSVAFGSVAFGLAGGGVASFGAVAFGSGGGGGGGLGGGVLALGAGGFGAGGGGGGFLVTDDVAISVFLRCGLNNCVDAAHRSTLQ
jgi:hypothetical protein